MKLRHAPLLVLREMARHATHRGLVADTLARVIQRPDEMTELLAIYWADALGPMQQRKKQPISAQIKKGLARAVTKFDAYQLAKYDRDGAVQNPGRAVPGARQAEGRRTGEGLEAARRGRAFRARHLGGLAFRWRRQARDVRAADRREEARRPRAAAQPPADAEGGSPSRDDRGGDRGHARRSHSALPLHHGGAVCAGLRARTRSLRC